MKTKSLRLHHNKNPFMLISSWGLDYPFCSGGGEMVNRDRITQQSPPLAIQDPDLGRPRRIRPTRCFSPSPGLAATATRQQRPAEGLMPPWSRGAGPS